MKTKAKWYTDEHNSTWDRVKAAFRNDWEQTKNDFGVKGNRDLDQDVDDTVEQMFGKESTNRHGEVNYDDREEAFRYGHAARRHYGEKHSTWNDDLRTTLSKDYHGDWERDEPYVRYAYDYKY